MAQTAQPLLMKQYEEMKKKHPDAILLFRVGDNYQGFKDDAKLMINLLETPYHVVNADGFGDVVYTEFKHNALDTYLPKLIRAGKRVAICEQLEDGKNKVVEEEPKQEEPKGIAIEQAFTASRRFGVFRTLDKKYYIGQNVWFTETNKDNIHGYLDDDDKVEVNEQTALFVQCHKNGDTKMNDFIRTHMEDFSRTVELLDQMRMLDSTVLPIPEDCRKAVEEYKNPKQEEPTKPTKKMTIKEFNCTRTTEQMRELGEPIAYFQMSVPKEAKNIGKYTYNKNDAHKPMLENVLVEPEHGKMIACDTSILYVVDVDCNGVWPDDENGKTFQCYVDSKAISAFAGKVVDVAVWQNGSAIITGCETEGAICQTDVKSKYPNWRRVIPENTPITVNINPDELKPLRDFMKANMGKTKKERENRTVSITTDRASDMMKVEITENRYGYEPTLIAETCVKLIDRADWYVRMIFKADLFYYSIQEDFGGVIYLIDESRPAKFLGEQRESILMPHRAEEGKKVYVTDDCNKTK